MRALLTSMFAMLSLLSVAVEAPASGDPRFGAAGRAGSAESAAPSASDAILAHTRAFSCADIGSTELFRSKGLQYVHSTEFAEALSAVASGDSRFAEEPVPPRWSAVAVNWRLHLATQGDPGSGALASGWERFPESGEDCSPRLIYLASREYASHRGHSDAKPVYPYYVQMAVYDLENRMAPFAAAATEIERKIESAEKLGAADCAPAELGRVKAELAAARRVAADSHFDPLRTGEAFGKAVDSADELLRGRQFARRHGFVCYSR